MKKLLFCRKCLCAALNRIPLVDKCLLVFFLVLLTQSAYSLFSHNGTGSDILCRHIRLYLKRQLYPAGRGEIKADQDQARTPG